MMLDSPAQPFFPHLARDFAAICDCGGRLTGSPSEKRAVQLLERLGSEASGQAVRRVAVPYGGWRALAASLTLEDGTQFACHPLVRSLATPTQGLEAEVLDLGRGTEEDFVAATAAIPGRIVMVRHELMFSATTVHRRLKYGWARQYGAIGFLIVSPEEGSLVSGSSGRTEEEGVPAAGISPETAARLAPDRNGKRPRVTLRIETEEHPAEATNLLFDMPGQVDEWVVLSAHIDGHDLGESAMDNATGLAAALSVARRLREEGVALRRGVRLALFNAEEWALTGSRAYVSGLSREEQSTIKLNVNIDTVGCGRQLTALTSGYTEIEPMLLRASNATGIPLNIFTPLQRNSDHANFAEAGIPAFRLVSGFDEPEASTRLLLTRYDTRNRVDLTRLEEAARLTHEIIATAAMPTRY